MPRRFSRFVFFGLAAAMSVAAAHGADLKTFYSGSNMASDGSSRVITLQISKDGTGLYENNSGLGDIKKNIHWFRDGKTVTIDLEPTPGKPPINSMIFKIERNSLVPAGTFDTQLGVFSFPTLHPFGPTDVVAGAGYSTCVSGMPGPCVMRKTWSSNGPQ